MIGGGGRGKLPAMGDVIGNYEIVAELKRGGMGVVYTARHQTMGQLAVVKKLLPEHTRSHDVVQRFFQEAQAAAALDDPGIVRIFDQGVLADGSAYIVMELLQGESLADRLRRVGRLAPEVAVTFMRQAARAVAKAHGRGIVHRDLKPDNLFIVPDPDVAGGERVKVLDFGIAKLAGDARVKTMTAMPMGTPVRIASPTATATIEMCSPARRRMTGQLFAMKPIISISVFPSGRDGGLIGAIPE